MGIIAVVAGVLLLPTVAAAQDDVPRSPWKYYPEEVRANEGPGGPAPVRDLTGTWVGESSGGGVKRLLRPESPPPYTPLGQQLADRNIVEGGEVIESLRDRVIGRVALDDVYDPTSGDLIVARNTEITEELAEQIQQAGAKKGFLV